MDHEAPHIGLFHDVLHFAAWLVASFGALVDLALARGLAQVVMTRLGAGMSAEKALQLRASGSSFGWTATVVGMTVTVALACLGLGLIIWLEYYLRRGAESERLLRRTIKALTIELGVGVAMYLASLLLSL